jgi:hypothetical protein
VVWLPTTNPTSVKCALRFTFAIKKSAILAPVQLRHRSSGTEGGPQNSAVGAPTSRATRAETAVFPKRAPAVYPAPGLNGSRAPSGRGTSKAKTTADIIW